MPTMSGYGLRYKCRITSNDGFAYQALLWQAGYAGSDAVVRLAEDALTVERGARGSDIYTPILASQAYLHGVRVTDELEDLIGAHPNDWRMQIYRGASHDAIDADNGTSIWLGRVLADIYEDSTMGGVQVIDVEAIDGIGVLEEIPYYDTSSPPDREPYTGRETYLTILIRALGKMGYSLPIRTAAAWRPSAVAANEDPIAMIEVDNLAFYSPDGEALTCFEVADEIARVWGARLCQWEGAWWLVARELQNGAAYTYFKYAADGTPDGTGTEGTAADATGASTNTTGEGVIRTEGRRTFRSAHSAVAVLQNHGPIPPLIDEGLMQEYAPRGRHFTTSKPQFVASNVWTFVGEAAKDEITVERVKVVGGRTRIKDQTVKVQDSFIVSLRNEAVTIPSFFHGSATDPDTVKALVATGNLSTAGPHYATRTSLEVDAGTHVQFTANVKIEHNEGKGEWLYTPYWALVIDGTNRYLKSDGTWGDSASVSDQAQYASEAPEDTIFGEYGFNLNSIEPVSVVSEPMPVSGALTLRLYGTSDSGTQLDPGNVLWDDVTVLVVDKTGHARSSYRTEVFVTDLPEPAREDIEVLTGAGPGVRLPTTQTISGVEIEDWTSNLLATPRALGALHAETVLRSQLSPLEARTETYRRLGASPIAPMQIGSNYYAAQELTHSFYHDIDSGEWVRVAWDASAAEANEGSTDVEGASYIPIDIGGGPRVREDPEGAEITAVFLTEQRLESGTNDDIWHIYIYDVDGAHLRRIRNGSNADDSMEMNAISWRDENNNLYRYQAQSGVGGQMLRTTEEGIGETIDGTLTNTTNDDHVIDELRDRMYISHGGGDPIVYAFGVHGYDLINGDINRGWRGMAYDGSRYLYIADENSSQTTPGDGTVQRFDLDTETSAYDGTWYYYQQDEIVADGLNAPYGIAVDETYIYVLEANEVIKRYLLDGTGGTTLLTGSLSPCRNMRVFGGFLWWVATTVAAGEGYLRRCAIDGTGLETVVTVAGEAGEGYVGLQGIDVGLVPA